MKQNSAFRPDRCVHFIGMLWFDNKLYADWMETLVSGVGVGGVLRRPSRTLE
jgi:hypothetical protein